MSPKFDDSWREKIRRWLWLFSIIWLGVAALVIGYDLWSDSDWPKWLTRIYFWATLTLSLLAFLCYGWDKRQARLDGRRISERTLHRFAIFGGWPGAVLGQQFFRHKTVKTGFQFKHTLILVAHLFVILWGLKNFLVSFLI